MGIDGIGKGGGIPPQGIPGEGVGIEKAGGTNAPFSIEGSQKSERTDAVAPSTSSDVARVRAGEISIDQYLDLKVDEATRGLEGVGAENLKAIKSMLRDQLSTDPALADLVQSATGHAPPAPSGENE